MSVCVPSQTISVMTTTGKSALRRKRFTNSLSAGYQRLFSRTMTRVSWVRHGVPVEEGHVGRMPVPVAEIEAVADHEVVRDLEPGVPHADIELAALRLRQESADLE